MARNKKNIKIRLENIWFISRYYFQDDSAVKQKGNIIIDALPARFS